LLVQSVIDFFNSRLDSINGAQAAAPKGQAEWSVGRVLELVQTFAQVSCRQRYVAFITALQSVSAHFCGFTMFSAWCIGLVRQLDWLS
jgi:hypothetical protein